MNSDSTPFLPKSGGEAAAPPRTGNPAPAPSPAGPAAGPRPLLLVVDDDAIVRMLAERHLGAAGFEVIALATGTPAVPVFRERQPDAVLLDVLLPDANGFDLCRAMRAVPGRSHTPIVILTDHDDEAAIHAAYEAGATQFVAKPIDWLNESYRLRCLLRAADAARELGRAEEALRASEEQFRALNANLAEGMVYQINSGPDGSQRRFTYLSPAVERLHGLPMAEVAQNPALIYGQVIEEDRGRLVEEEARAFRNRTALDIDVRVVLPSGAMRWRRFTSSPRACADGTLVWDGIELDITERKRDEAALRQRTSQLAAINALGREVTASLSLDQAAAAAVRGMLDAIRADVGFLFLREGERLVLQSLFPPGVRERLATIREHRVGECLCGLAARNHEPIYSSRLVCDRRCTWEECKRAGIQSFAALPLMDEESVVGVIGLASMAERDFEGQAELLETMVSQVAAALKNARLYAAVMDREDRYRRLLDHMSAGVVVHAPDASIRFANRSACQMLGLPAEQMLGKRVSDLGWSFVREDGTAIREEDYPVQLALDGGAPAKDTVVGLDRPGGKPRIWVLMKAFAESNGGGKAGHLVVTFSDITELKRAQAEHEELQAQISQAQKMELVGRLAGGVAHDVNNMLQAILGNVDLAAEAIPSGSPARDNIEEVRKSAERTATLVRQLLAFARKQPIQPRVLDLNETVERMSNMLRRLIGENVELAWKPGASLWPVTVDPIQADQILTNLCVNARDAMPAGGCVTIETANGVRDDAFAARHPDAAPGDYVMLAVSDSGCGMDAATRSHLFEPFFTTKDLGKGTGLGLATVFGIVQQNAGLIGVETELGRGTTIRIYLPRAASNVAATQAVQARPPGGGRETILLAEDDEAILHLTRAMLERYGYTVLAAATPRAAEALAAQHPGPIDLLVTDVVMPGMYGPQLRDRLLAGRPGMRSVFMSGYPAEFLAPHGILTPEVHFLRKPFGREALGKIVRKALDSGRTGEQA